MPIGRCGGFEHLVGISVSTNMLYWELRGSDPIHEPGDATIVEKIRKYELYKNRDNSKI